MELWLYGDDKPHPAIAASLNNLGSVFRKLGNLGNELEKYKQSLKMKHGIHGHDEPHPDIASSLNNIATVYQALGKLE